MAALHIIESKYDVDLAKAIVEELQSFGHIVTWDLNYLIPGVEWKQSLKEAVINCDGMIAVFTDNSVNCENVITSQWMSADIGAARAYGKFIIPLIIGENAIIPNLIDDIYAIVEKDRTRTAQIAKKIDEACKSHMVRRASEIKLDLPVGYQHLSSAILRFHQDTPYNQSVFVMMKFPQEQNTEAKSYKLLTEIWEELSQTLLTYGLTARRTDKKSYHDQLWENVCVYLFGCRYGLAILEDRVAQELNPNVTLEYGFMKALSREVVLIRDVNFKHDRADLTGKLSKSFEIDEEGILNKSSLVSAIEGWLLDVGLPPKVRR